ncbi:MAG TPA: hypothetical protein VK210_15535 [Terriglobia bacterium]|nr:hypothetical protein [Terriglobia bacterium]
MIQGPPRTPPPIGIVYNTSMSRPDSALALAAVYAFDSKREAKIGSVCVVGAGLDAAIFCDVVARFYSGSARNGNEMLAVGLAAVTPLPTDLPMVKSVVERRKDNGDLQYNRSVRKVSDTSLAEAVLRNGVLFNAESVMVLSAPATFLARALDITGTRDIFKQRVKRLVIVDSAAMQQDPASLRRIVAEWPGPVFLCGPDVGQALVFPGASLDKMYEWAPAHPVADAYRAFKSMPYDAPLHDLAAMHYAVHPDSGYFTFSNPGSIAVGDDGSVRFSVGAGNVHRLSIDPIKKADALAALIAIASVPTGAATRTRG